MIKIIFEFSCEAMLFYLCLAATIGIFLKIYQLFVVNKKPKNI